MPNYGLLAQQGRREDNAAMGGQVAHISAVEAELLRLLGGAGTTNPMTGLPEYQSGMGFTAALGPGGGISGVGFSGPGGPGGGGGGSGGGGDGLTKTQQSKLFNWNLAPEGPQSVTSKTMAALQAKAKAKGGWGDQTMNAIFNLVSKVSPTMMLVNAIKNAVEGGDGQTQTQTQTAAPPAISPTYAPTTGSIVIPRLAQVIAEPPPEEEKEVAEAELFDLGFPESPLLAGQRVFDAEVLKTTSPEYLAQFGPAIQDVLLQHVADQLLQRAQRQGQLA